MRHLGLISTGLLVSLFVSGYALDATAGTIYHNGPPSPSEIVQPTSDAGMGGFWYQVADDFVLAPGSNTIDLVRWWGVYGDNDFTIQIFSGTASPAADPLHSFDVGAVDRIDSGMRDSFNQVIYVYSVGIAPTTLDADSIHFLSIYNDSSTSVWGWITTPSDFGGTYHSRANDPWGAGPWSQPNPVFDLDLAFELEGEVIPEPGTFLLLGGGLVALARLRRRQASGE
jgi:hypothetical protein